MADKDKKQKSHHERIKAQALRAVQIALAADAGISLEEYIALHPSPNDSTSVESSTEAASQQQSKTVTSDNSLNPMNKNKSSRNSKLTSAQSYSAPKATSKVALSNVPSLSSSTTSLSKSQVVWDIDYVREMMSLRLWPTFIGQVLTAQTYSKSSTQNESLNFPLFIWKEQLVVIQENQNSHLSRLARKRKTDEIDLDTVNDNATSSATNKKARTTLWDNITSTILNAFTYPSLWVRQRVPWVWPLTTLFPSFTVTASQSPSEATTKSNCTNVVSPVTAGTCIRTCESYANNVSEIRTRVYTALHKANYFIGFGDAYGGDYSIYKLDPSNSHSIGTVRVVSRALPDHCPLCFRPSNKSHTHDNSNSATNDDQSNCQISHRSGTSLTAQITEHASISALDFLSFCRVQNQVAKNAVFGFIDSESNLPAFIITNFVYVSQKS